MRATVAASLLFASSEAVAACPGPVAVGEAYTLFRSVDGLANRVERTGPNEVTVREMRDGKTIATMRYLHGVWLLEQRNVSSDEVTVRNTFTPRPNGLPPEGAVVQTDHTARYIRVTGTKVFEAVNVVKNQGSRMVKLGACAYEARIVNVGSFQNGELRTLYQKRYVPELGYAVSSAKLDRNGKVVHGVEFDRIAAE